MSKYKECDPCLTIERIVSLLESKNIDIEIIEFPNVGTYSCNVRACFNNVEIATSNGKGTNREYALASGLAELMERLSNIISKNNFFVNTAEFQNKNLQRNNMPAFKGDILLGAKDIVSQPLFKELYSTYGQSTFLPLIKNQNITKETIICSPYINILSEEINYIPYYGNGISLLTGTNGMCAGNSFKEAMVEGISEIFERIAIKEVVYNNYACPNIDLSIINQYPYIKKIVVDLEQKGYSVQLKDFSCGGKFPSVALVLTDLKHGTSKVNIASNPIFHIAVERCFTEIFQNRNLNTLKDTSFTMFPVTHLIGKRVNFAKICKNGFGIFPEHVIYQNNLTPNFDRFIFDINEELSIDFVFEKIKDILRHNGYHCWYKTADYFGFDCYHIILSNEKTSPAYIDQESLNEAFINATEKSELFDFAHEIGINNKDVDHLYELTKKCFNKKLHLEYVDFVYDLNNNKNNLTEILYLIMFFLCMHKKDYEKANYFAGMISQKIFINEEINNLLVLSILLLDNKNKTITSDKTTEFFKFYNININNFENNIYNKIFFKNVILNYENYFKNTTTQQIDFFHNINTYI